ncbi:Kinesin-like protein [Quillaja saponaria]|uniref:Kinesin-like protein n=1 Tax=Quillaja saponaria TaxID=32244 RepID=A0AAD7Q815_QUISA|nr:Kinesin-like protein [Quillaja saponaria]
MKRLHGQNSLLERDISKRDASKHDSFAGRRRESVIDKSSRVSDLKKTKGLAGAYEQSLQVVTIELEEYRKLEVFAFESETRIASLEDELTSACGEKEEAISINEGLASELESLNEKLNKSNSELYNLQEEISDLRRNLEESNITQQKLESSIKTLVEEKEELAMRLTDSLLEIEEERAIWYVKEKASIQAIEDKSRLYSEEIMSISERMSDVRNELDSCRDECRVLRERLTSSNENPQLDEICRGKSMVNDQLKSDLQTIADCRQTQEISKPSLEMLSSDNDYACEKSSLVKKEIDALRNEKEELLTRLTELGTGSELLNDIQLLKEQLFTVTKERDKLMIQIEEQQNHVIGVEFLQKQCNDELLETKNQVEELSRRTSGMEVKMHDTDVNNSKEKAKLRMQIRGTQAQLDAFRVRYKEAIDESDLMNKKYEEAAGKLKDRLASKGIEVLNLKKQLAAQ